MSQKVKKRLDKRSKFPYITIETFKFLPPCYKNMSRENDKLVGRGSSE
jgi:hypothetical protein